MGFKLSKDDFIKRSIEEWGEDKYDYSKLVWINFSTKIILICREHNYEFEQKPQKHLKGQNGCKYCSNKGLNTEDYINRSKQLFGEEHFDYSKVEYKNYATPVTITCKIHQVECTQTPYYHFKGANPCKECNGQTPLNNESFIKKSKEVHGEGKFDYSKVTGVTNIHAKVTLTCKEHNEEFEQGVRVNLRGNNPCPKCNKYSRVTKEEYLRRFKKAHGDKNDYSLINWDDPSLNIKSYVPIRCKVHNITFKQTLDLHIQGRVSCPKCKSYTVSAGEKELAAFIETFGFKPVYNSRKLMDNGKEIDIWIEELKIAFEYNGDYWHSDEVIKKREGISADEYHQLKVDGVEAIGGELHFIWDEDWHSNKDINKEKVKNILEEASLRTLNKKLNKPVNIENNSEIIEDNKVEKDLFAGTLFEGFI